MSNFSTFKFFMSEMFYYLLEHTVLFQRVIVGWALRARCLMRRTELDGYETNLSITVAG